MLAYGFLGLDLPEYFQRLSFGWRGLSLELLVVHLFTSLRFPVRRRIARRFMRRKGCFLSLPRYEQQLRPQLLGGSFSVRPSKRESWAGMGLSRRGRESALRLDPSPLSEA